MGKREQKLGDQLPRRRPRPRGLPGLQRRGPEGKAARRGGPEGKEAAVKEEAEGKEVKETENMPLGMIRIVENDIE